MHTMQALDTRLKQDSKEGTQAAIVKVDCTELPCISYLDVRGAALQIEKTGDLAKDNAALVAKAHKYINSILDDTLADDTRVAVPFLVVTSPADGEAQAALSFMPVDHQPVEGERITPDPLLMRSLSKRAALFRETH
jgi:hypothetical protein